MFASARGSPAHRQVGKLFLALMVVTAIAALFIDAPRLAVTVGPLRIGLFHLIVPLTVWGAVAAITTVRRRDIVGHRRAMKGLFFGTLGIAGVLTLIPGRLMHAVFFG